MRDLLKEFDNATAENPMVITPHIIDELTNLLRRRNAGRGQAGYYISPDIAGYTCPVTGKYVEGRAEHRENLKRQGCRVLEPGEREQFERDKPKEVDRHADKVADFLSDKIAARWDAPA